MTQPRVRTGIKNLDHIKELASEILEVMQTFEKGWKDEAGLREDLAICIAKSRAQMLLKFLNDQ
jgi:hypothetical protein